MVDLDQSTAGPLVSAALRYIFYLNWKFRGRSRERPPPTSNHLQEEGEEKETQWLNYQRGELSEDLIDHLAS